MKCAACVIEWGVMKRLVIESYQLFVYNSDWVPPNYLSRLMSHTGAVVGP